MGVLGVVANGSCTCCCHLLSIVVDFMILFDIYCFLFELADDIYSVLVLVLTTTCVFSLCYLWSAANVPSSSTQSQL